MPTHYQLLGAEVSYYTGKVRAYLRYKQLPFEEVLATREVYRDVIVPKTGVRFIPVLIVDGDAAIQDSAAIIDHLEARHPTPSILPSDAVGELVALLFELYADEWLVLPAMHYRWNVPENRAFAIQEFGRLSVPGAAPEEQRAVGEKLAGPFAGALRPLGVTEETTAAVEASYREFLDEFSDHLAAHPYLLGGRPSRGDFALFGPLYAHLYRDPASGRYMQAVAPRVADWVERMRDPQRPASDVPVETSVPSTLWPLVARMFREFGPVLARTIERLAAFEIGPGEPLPRAVGVHAFDLGNAVGQRAIYPFNVWRWQRVRDHYDALDPASRSRADVLLERVNGLGLVRSPLSRRLVRTNNRLMFAD